MHKTYDWVIFLFSWIGLTDFTTFTISICLLGAVEKCHVSFYSSYLSILLMAPFSGILMWFQFATEGPKCKVIPPVFGALLHAAMITTLSLSIAFLKQNQCSFETISQSVLERISIVLLSANLLKILVWGALIEIYRRSEVLLQKETEAQRKASLLTSDISV